MELSNLKDTLSLSKQQRVVFCSADRELVIEEKALESLKKDTSSLSIVQIPKTKSTPVFVEVAEGVIAGEDVSHLDFQATELINIGGLITYKGKALRMVSVDAGIHGKFETDKEGRFCLKDIPEGSEYSFTLKKHNYIFDIPEFYGIAEKDRNFETDSTQLFSIAGTVLHKGIPLSGVEIDAGQLGIFITDEYGSFLIRDIHESVEYELVPSKAGYSFSTPGSSGSLSSGSVSLLFAAKKLHSISGVVRHRGKALAGARVYCEELGDVFSDAEGRYEFKDAPEDITYEIKIEKKGFRFSR